ncbi:MAG: hypothetical protein WD249_10885 [Gaiellaceae bacterium]
MARSKNRQTFNKMARERDLKERRALKQAKKDEKKRIAAEGEEPTGEAESAEPELSVDAES